MNGHANGSAGSPATDFDVIIVGAGISGINAGYRVQDQLPGFSYSILEARDDLGGTWDLFKYPGIRSDSDLFTFGFAFNPWNRSNPIAEGSAIKSYVRDTAEKFGIAKNIRFRNRLNSADWSSTENVWSLNVDADGTPTTLRARFANIPNLDDFQGQIIHPQFWPENLDYAGKKVVIIGSGATAITLLPNLAEKAERVTMLQRSPTYILSLPNRSNSRWLAYLLPSSLYHRLQRFIWIYTSRIFFLFCQRFPGFSRWILRQNVSRQLPSHISHDPHFKPRYNPWDQRLCVCPDGDFFQSLRRGKADVRTDTIKTVTKRGITLNSGESLDADIIVTATGLQLQIAGGSNLTVDGKKIEIGSKFLWNGVMLQDLPNASFIIGYTNASWTLGADATVQFITRLLRTMKERKLVSATPRMRANEEKTLEERPLLNLNSTYVTVASKHLPMAGDKGPWQARDHYHKDIKFATNGDLETGMDYVKGNVQLRPKQA
ncbi:unnamed protein product [Penicillium manginii]